MGDRFPKLSVLRLEFEIPKRWSQKLYAAAEEKRNPFFDMEETLTKYLGDPIPNHEVRLIGFVIDDH